MYFAQLAECGFGTGEVFIEEAIHVKVRTGAEEVNLVEGTVAVIPEEDALAAAKRVDPAHRLVNCLEGLLAMTVDAMEFDGGGRPNWHGVLRKFRQRGDAVAGGQLRRREHRDSRNCNDR